MAPKYRWLIGILTLGVALDQATKLWISQTYPLHSITPVIQGFFNLVYVTNRGAAFSLLSNWSSPFVALFFAGVSLVILGVLGYLFWRLPAQDNLAAAGYSLVMAGAVGNLIDRLRLGEVIDFLDFYVSRFHWPAFNIADSLVCIGAGVLLIAIWRTEEEPHVSDAL